MTNAPHEVVELPNAGVPADHGVSSLALLMQLAGTVFGIGAVLIALLSFFTMRSHGDTSISFVALALCLPRSLLLRRAGYALLYEPGGWDAKYPQPPPHPLAAVRLYIVERSFNRSSSR